MSSERKQEITASLTAKRRTIASLSNGLKYADHGAYGQDKSRISALEREVLTLGKELLTLI
jgi:hypothetical protein